MRWSRIEIILGAIVLIGGASGVVASFTGWEFPFALSKEVTEAKAELSNKIDGLYLLAADTRRDYSESQLKRYDKRELQIKELMYQHRNKNPGKPLPDWLINELTETQNQQRKYEDILEDPRKPTRR